VFRSKHVEPSIDFGIINSITKLRLVDISTEWLTENNVYVQYESQSINALREKNGVYFQNNRKHTVWQYTELFGVTAGSTDYRYSEVLISSN